MSEGGHTENGSPNRPFDSQASGPALLPLTVGVTGHRDLCADQVPKIYDALCDFYRELHANYKFTPIRLISGLAEGADRLAIEALRTVQAEMVKANHSIAMQWQVVAALPASVQEYEADFPASVLEYHTILSLCDEIVVLSADGTCPNSDGEGHFQAGYRALAGYLQRHSNVLLALWDGCKSFSASGTYDVVQARLGLGVGIELPSMYLDSGLVRHIQVGRIKSLQSTDTRVVDRGWLSPKRRAGELDTWLQDFCKIDALNSEIAVTLGQATSLASFECLSPSTAAYDQMLEVAPSDLRLVARLHVATDTLATFHDRARKRIVTAIHVLGALLALSLWTAMDGLAQPLMTSLYVAVSLALFLLFQLLQKHAYSHDSIFYRLLSEVLRTSFYHRLVAALPDAPKAITIASPLEALLAQQIHEIDWVREALRFDLGMPARKLASNVLEEHLRCWVDSQHAYFKKAELRQTKLLARLNRAKWAFGIIGVCAAAFVVANDTLSLGLDTLRHVTSISAAVLPAVALLLQSYSDQMALEQQAKASSRMQWVYGRALATDPAAKQSATQSFAPLEAVCKEALLEVVNWCILRKSRPPTYPS